MKFLFLAVILLVPLTVMANEWGITCSGVSLTVSQSAKDGYFVKKDNNIYPIVGGFNQNGNEMNVYAKYMDDVRVNDNNIIPVDANQSLTLIQAGTDGHTKFRFLDGRGNHSCSLSSFKAGE
ncbi:hypothetical protein ACMYSL_14225 [Klebsiella sp. MISC125]|uniref:hypothetical protein n=1 Tax=Klebsiella sp. MISC125 TaxID=2755386 RepID=UPI003DA7E974